MLQRAMEGGKEEKQHGHSRTNNGSQVVFEDDALFAVSSHSRLFAFASTRQHSGEGRGFRLAQGLGGGGTLVEALVCLFLKTRSHQRMPIMGMPMTPQTRSSPFSQSQCP